jgi:transcriptional regulator
MYVPTLFGDASPRDIQEIVEQYSFATLITHRDDELEISHLPLALDGTLAGGVLRGHMARANSQLALCTGQTRACAIFQGPHTYVSPSWYASPGVPTWNYISVHCHGSIHLDMKIERVEAQFKLSQNKSQEDRDRVIERLNRSNSNSDLVQWMTKQS